MKKRNIRVVTFTLALTFTFTLLTTSVLKAQSTTIVYPSSKVEIANPERGWYDDYYSYAGGSNMGNTFKPLKTSELLSMRENDNITLILRLFYLHKFLEEDQVSQEYLDWMQADFDSIRAAGVKCVLRFAYSASQKAAVWDATPEKVFSHIESLADVLAANGDVIAGVQAGFIGAWGEWYYTKNFAGQGYVPDATDQENRRTLVEKLLTILPDHVSVQGRTPAIMRNIVGTEDPITEAEAFDGSFKSRTGHHNDCFLANASDYGTYTNLEKDLAYLHETTKYTITGGETCDASNQYSDCVNGVPRMVELHWTYLNRDYNKAVYDKWKEQGCYEEINISMGYRIHLVSATIANGANSGTSMPVSFTFSNLGYAAPTQYKPFHVVLTHAESGAETVLDYEGTFDDIRFWLPGEITAEGSIAIPSDLPDGNYMMALRFADKDAGLSLNPAYSIQLANVESWDIQRGLNMLNHMVSVGTGGEGSLPLGPTSLEGSAVSEIQIDLTWSYEAADETGFEIMRATDDDMIWEKVAELDPGTTSYSDVSLNKGTYYQYMVRSLNTYGSSPWSEILTIHTLGVGIEGVTKPVVEIFPNPLSSGNLTISFADLSEKKIVITDLSGRKIFDTVTSDSQININSEDLQPGVLLVTLIHTDGTSSERILVL